MSFIRVTTIVDTHLGRKIYQSFCIPIDNQEELMKGFTELIKYCTQRVCLLVGVELVEYGRETESEKQ